MSLEEEFYIKLHQYLIWKNRKPGDCPELVTEKSLWNWIIKLKFEGFEPNDSVYKWKVTYKKGDREYDFWKYCRTPQKAIVECNIDFQRYTGDLPNKYFIQCTKDKQN